MNAETQNTLLGNNTWKKQAMNMACAMGVIVAGSHLVPDLCDSGFISQAFANDYGIFGSIDTSSGTGNFDTQGIDSLDSLTIEFKKIAAWMSAMMAVIMLISMLWQFAKLGNAGDNEQARKKASMGILTSGIALALFGGSSIVVGFFWNILDTSTTDGGGGDPAG